jgi:hypothetical protein
MHGERIKVCAYVMQSANFLFRCMHTWSFDFEKFKRVILCVRVSIRTSTTVLRPALKMSRCRHFYTVPCIGGHLEFETMLDPRFGQEVATFHH